MEQRPALGQIARIGAFYDATSDTFLPASLLNDGNAPDDVISTTRLDRQILSTSNVDSYEDKFSQMGVGIGLGASVVADLVRTSGSGQYLVDHCESNKILQTALHHTLLTVQERIDFTSARIKDLLAKTELDHKEVTHVVTGIEWGARSVFVFRVQSGNDAQLESQRKFLIQSTEAFRQRLESFRPTNQSFGGPNNSIAGMALDITVYSDILSQEGILLRDISEAEEFVDLMPLHVKDENGGKGYPVTYTLPPIQMLTLMLPVQILGQPSPALTNLPRLEDCAKMFDNFWRFRRMLNDTLAEISTNQLYMPPTQLRNTEARMRDLDMAYVEVRSKLTQILPQIRLGTLPPEALQELLSSQSAAMLSDKQSTPSADGNLDKIAFIEAMVKKGAIYVGYNNLDIESEIARHGNIDFYVFSFNEASMQGNASWTSNQSLLLELLESTGRKSAVALVDCDATGTPIGKAHIAQYEHGERICDDVLDDRQYLADKCLARYADGSLDTNDVQKPLQRRFIKIACPGTNCSPNEICDWVCFSCFAPLEYGFTDEYVYCDCGRASYTKYEFRCRHRHHGTNYSKYDNQMLLPLLSCLSQSDYLNILILGETGVGKSTFINSFVNYLSFETLEDSMKAEKLNWLIPCSFSTQVIDRTRADGKIDEISVKVGSRKDEMDGSKGASATQQTTVYPVTIGSSTIRLFDTPGIGDTRGIDHDRQNMCDILSTLSSYDELHGVLILVKGNTARLTVQFIFCIQELLMHLHRSAAKNVAFGFTNTRISNYLPGDTFGILKSLLERHRDLGLSLTARTTYCFDSESFRYLAAYKNNVCMENEEDFRRSWKHSRTEALRLMDYFRSTTPHAVKSTISLNGTRELISELTKPMAEISQLIGTNIALSKDRIEELKTTRLTGDKLRRRLQLQKIQLIAEPLTQPRTVCAHGSCVEYKDDGQGNNNVVTVYKTHCHDVCYLSNVPVNTIAHAELVGCAAFSGSQNCKKCTHHWQHHMHVLYELREEMATVTDTEIEKQIQKNADDVTLKTTAVSELVQVIKEYKIEHEQIQKAAAQFGLFLREHSMTGGLNDATLDYLDSLIKEEKRKRVAGGNSRKLDALQKDRQKYEELLKIMKSNIRQGSKSELLTEQGVDAAVKELYKMKHFGKNLQSVKQTISSVYQATYREMPFRVDGRTTRRRGQSTQSSARPMRRPSFPQSGPGGSVQLYNGSMHQHPHQHGAGSKVVTKTGKFSRSLINPWSSH